MRVEQRGDAKGSLKWIRRLIAQYPELLEGELREAGALSFGAVVDWRSPREGDAWAEYRDGDFLGLLDRSDLRDALERFWPRRGPQWDALGRSPNGALFLVEAKAHLAELKSSCAAKAPTSRALIAHSLGATRAALAAADSDEWLTGYYQYANRLAHLHFLREQGVEAYLVFVYFFGHTEMPGSPISRADWDLAMREVYQRMGIEACLPMLGLINVYLDVRLLSDAGTADPDQGVVEHHPAGYS